MPPNFKEVYLRRFTPGVIPILKKMNYVFEKPKQRKKVKIQEEVYKHFLRLQGLDRRFLDYQRAVARKEIAIKNDQQALVDFDRRASHIRIALWMRHRQIRENFDCTSDLVEQLSFGKLLCMLNLYPHVTSDLGDPKFQALK